MTGLLVLRSCLWHTSVRPARKGAEAMVKQKILAIMSAIALALSPVVAVAGDSGVEQGSLARTGTGVAQLPPEQQKQPDCLIHDEDEAGCVLTVAEGGVVAAVTAGVAICVLACSGGGGNGAGATTTTTTTTSTTTTN